MSPPQASKPWTSPRPSEISAASWLHVPSAPLGSISPWTPLGSLIPKSSTCLHLSLPVLCLCLFPLSLWFHWVSSSLQLSLGPQSHRLHPGLLSPFSTSVPQVCAFNSALQASVVTPGFYLFGSAWVSTTSASTKLDRVLAPLWLFLPLVPPWAFALTVLLGFYGL